MKENIFNRNEIWILTFVVSFIWILFLDSNNILNKVQISKDIKELEIQKEYYLNRIIEDSTIMEMLKDDSFLETYAREHYLMKNKNETIYLINQP